MIDPHKHFLMPFGPFNLSALLFAPLALRLLGGAAVLGASGGHAPVKADVNPTARDAQRHIAVVVDDPQLSARLKGGWQLSDVGDTSSAIGKFQAVVDDTQPGAPARLEALYALGDLYSFKKPVAAPAQARRCYEQVIDEAGKNRALIAWAKLELGRLAGVDTPAERELGRTYFRAVMAIDKDRLYVHEAALRLASNYFFESNSRKLAQRGVEVLESHLKRYPHNQLAWLMYFRLIYWYEAVHQDYKHGVEYSLKLAELGMADPYRQSSIYWNLAQIYRRNFHEPAKALYWYERLVRECPGDMRLHAARQYAKQLRRAGYQPQPPPAHSSGPTAALTPNTPGGRGLNP